MFANPAAFLAGNQTAWETLLTKRGKFIEEAMSVSVPSLYGADLFQSTRALLQHVRDNLVTPSSDPAHQHDLAVLNYAIGQVTVKSREAKHAVSSASAGREYSYNPGISVAELIHESGNGLQQHTLAGAALSPESLIMLLRDAGIVKPSYSRPSDVRRALERTHERASMADGYATNIPGLSLQARRIILSSNTGREMFGETGGEGIVRWVHQYNVALMLNPQTPVALSLIELQNLRKIGVLPYDADINI